MAIRKKAAKYLLTAFIGASAALPAFSQSNEQANEQANEQVNEQESATARANAPAAPPETKTAISYINNLHLAYIRSGDEREDQISHTGLEALRFELTKNTSVEPAGVAGLDIEQDDISYFPFIYWPVPSVERDISPAAQMKIQNYINNGGVIMIDIKDPESTPGSNQALREMLDRVNIREITPVQDGDTLTQTFYLLSSDLRGSNNHKQVRTQVPDRRSPSAISSLIIGENNWSAAWAGITLRGMTKQREKALRAGVNFVMYALTGDYKSDHIHKPVLDDKRQRRPDL